MTQERRQVLRDTRAKLASQVEDLKLQAHLESTALDGPGDASKASTSAVGVL